MIPASVKSSPLMRRGGFDIFEGMCDELIRKKLLVEALSLYRDSTNCALFAPDQEEIRGGSPPRSFRSAAGGEFQDAFYRAQWMVNLLRSITSPALGPTGNRGTYSYYVRPGDFLGIHRDIVTCEVAVITCLSNGAEADSDAGRLCLYPERVYEPLSEIRAAPDRGAVKLRLEVGQTLVMYGGIIPHCLLPTTRGQARIVSVLCYDFIQ
jgi:hypothetical protein